MCFSSTASFIAGGALSAIGLASLSNSKSNSQVMFAAIPLLFGIQQISEGFLWLSLQHSRFSNWQVELTYVFLFFAQALWTTWIPLSFRLMETNKVRKLMLTIVTILGFMASCVLGLRLMFYPVTVEILEHHIYYGINSPHWMVIFSSVCYVMAIIFPPFISSFRGMNVLGAILLLSLLVTKLFFSVFLISVWCFFAAAISAAIIYIIRDINQHTKSGIGTTARDVLSGINKQHKGLSSH